MFNKKEALALLARIKENRRKLDACVKHAFGDVVGDRTGGHSIMARLRTCNACGGEMEDQDIIIYAKGFKAAGGCPDEIARYVDGESIA